MLLLPRDPMTIRTSFLSKERLKSSLFAFFIDRAFSLQGFPVKITLSLGKSFSVDSKLTPTLSAYLDKYLFDSPTTEFCS